MKASLKEGYRNFEKMARNFRKKYKMLYGYGLIADIR